MPSEPQNCCVGSEGQGSSHRAACLSGSWAGRLEQVNSIQALALVEQKDPSRQSSFSLVESLRSSSVVGAVRLGTLMGSLGSGVWAIVGSGVGFSLG